MGDMREVEAGISLSGDGWGAPGWDVLEIITSSSADGITIQDATGALIYANDAAARMSGFVSGQEMQRASTEEIVGRFEIQDEDGRPLRSAICRVAARSAGNGSPRRSFGSADAPAAGTGGRSSGRRRSSIRVARSGMW